VEGHGCGRQSARATAQHGADLGLRSLGRRGELRGRDAWGPATRIPAIIISPYAKKGYVDSVAYDTTSIIKFITRRFGLEPLPGVRQVVSDPSNALDTSQ